MKKDDIIAVLVGFSLLLHIAGYFFWPLIKFVNLYYVSIYNLVMITGLSLMLSLTGQLMRYVSTAMFTFGGGFLYMEFAGDPQNWTKTNIATFCFIGLNSLLLSHFIEKRKNGNHTTNF